MKRLFAAAVLAAPLAAPGMAGADEVSDTISAALEAYEAGDVGAAKEELDYASQLLGQMQADTLTGHLPAPLPGWEREVGDAEAAAAMFGGGIAARAEYFRDGDTLQIEIMADNPMVGSMAAMLGNSAMMAAMGRVKRIGGEKFVLQDGEIMGLIGGRFMVRVEGTAPEADKIAYLEAMDFDALQGM